MCEKLQEVVTNHMRMTHKIEHLEAQVEEMERRRHPLAQFRRDHLSVLQVMHSKSGNMVRKMQELAAL
jgi:hypothetical protein